MQIFCVGETGGERQREGKIERVRDRESGAWDMLKKQPAGYANETGYQ
jgi:hypothetical protein